MQRKNHLFFGVAAVGLLLSACDYREVDGVGTRTYDDQYVPQNDLTAFDGCTRTELGQWQPQGTVTNHTPDMATYNVTIAFYDGDTRLEERGLWIQDLHPNEAAELNRGWWINSPDLVTRCDVLTINRFTTPIADFAS